MLGHEMPWCKQILNTSPQMDRGCQTISWRLWACAAPGLGLGAPGLVLGYGRCGCGCGCGHHPQPEQGLSLHPATGLATLEQGGALHPVQTLHLATGPATLEKVASGMSIGSTHAN